MDFNKNFAETKAEAGLVAEALFCFAFRSGLSFIYLGQKQIVLLLEPVKHFKLTLCDSLCIQLREHSLEFVTLAR